LPKELLGSDDHAVAQVATRDARALEIVALLRELIVPAVPATLDESAASRGNVHFVLKALWSTPFFARYPHVMWVFRDLLNQSITEIINEFLHLSTASTMSRVQESERRASDLRSSRSGSFTRVPTDSDRWPMGEPTARAVEVDLTEVLSKLDDVLISVHDFAHSNVAIIPQHSNGTDEEIASLVEFLKEKKVPNPDIHAKILSRECITVEQLQTFTFTRDELRSAGLPLGIAVRLVP
jgi:hypothetical protein